MRIPRALFAGAMGCCLALALLASPADAQFLGHNFTGDMGLMSGTQAPPGWNLAVVYLRFDGETLRDRDGNSIALDPEERGSLDVNSYALALTYVTEHKILGGTYGFGIFPAFTDNRFQAPILFLNEKVDTGFTDLNIQPITLGWSKQRADFTAGLSLYVPTGTYELGADDNLGMGMWTFELFGGTTVYLDKAKSWHLATAAFYETHTKKEDTDIRVGDILTLEGGLGKSWMEGALTAGIAYYAQWKVTADDPGGDLQPVFEEFFGKHRGYGFGPELTVPIATSKKLIGFINARFLWETGIRSQLEGTVFTLAASFPIPSIALQ
ncbi:MAG: transporter [Thermoanaerobaculia bacterium]